MDGERTPVRRPPPHLGQHTDEVLREVLAMDDQAIAAARAQQAI
jgi:crotonobetainyl-CoA:carnitine CoA-transferase CaiB-like acyl-CoA transferase